MITVFKRYVWIHAKTEADALVEIVAPAFTALQEIIVKLVLDIFSSCVSLMFDMSLRVIMQI